VIDSRHQGGSFATPVVAKDRLWYQRLADVSVLTGYEYRVESRDLKSSPATTLVSGLDDFSACLLLSNGRFIYTRMDRPHTFQGGSLFEIQADFRTVFPRGEPRRITDWPEFEISGLSGTADAGLRQSRAANPGTFVSELLAEYHLFATVLVTIL
jgi:hypothetical protein